MIPVGTKVIINSEGHDRYKSGPDNPVGLVGIVEDSSEEHDWIDVSWPNGEENVYEIDTLDIVED